MAARDILTLNTPMAERIIRLLYTIALVLIAIGTLFGIGRGVMILTHTPMQRPAVLGDRAALTDQELAKREAQAARQAASDGEEVATQKTAVTINPPGYWVERAAPNRQASLVIDPPDGRIPPLTPEAR